MSAARTAIVRRRRRRGLRAEGPGPRSKLLLALLAVVGVMFVGMAAAAGGTGMYALSRYDEIADSVVPPEELIGQQPRGGARIYDRNGTLLYEFVDELSGLRRPVGLDRISQHLIDATIAVEDPTFYENNGVNTRGLVRAGLENFAPFLMGNGDSGFLQGSGGSSITQQLAKNVYIPREERAERSIDRKVKETVIALELTEKYSKDQILEWYLNSISYGGIYTGIEAAAEGYFDKSAADLTLAEASLLAGIPQSPALYDPFSSANINPETGQLSVVGLAKSRQGEVLRLMAERGYITQEEAEDALETELVFSQRRFEIQAPHFVLGRIASEIRARFGERALYDQGLEVTTTLDLNLQDIAQEILEQQITENGEVANLYNGAFVAIDPRTSEILVYVGSRDYFRDDIEGRNDNVVALNSPGSTLKPFAFITAFMKGWGTGTAILDTPFKIVDFSTGEEFVPRNPTAAPVGPITAAKALGNSLNVTAIKTILFAGVENTIDTLRKVGYTTFDNPGGYGPALITGGSEITLLDEVYAYSVLATNGVMRGHEVVSQTDLDIDERELEPAAILRVTDSEGRLVYEFDEPQETQVLNPAYPYMITSILSDGQNTCLTYGVCNALALPNGYPSAAKTGTSEPFEDSRDIGETWTVGYTPELVAGMWAGNADNARIQGITSTSVSFRAWRDFMVAAIDYLDLPPTPFERPPEVVSREVCWPSGKLPTPACPDRNRYTSLYAAEALPGGDPTQDELERMYDTWWQGVAVDTRTGMPASEGTPSRYIRRQVRLVLPPDEVRGWGGLGAWAASAGVGLGYTGQQDPSAPLPALIVSPSGNSRVSGTITIHGRAASEHLQSYAVEWGLGSEPNAWMRLAGGSRSATGALAAWNTTSVPDGLYTIRVVIRDEELGARHYQIPIHVNNDGGGDGPGTPDPDATATPDPQQPTPDGGTGEPIAVISSPGDGQQVSGSVSVTGTATSPNVVAVRVEVAIPGVGWMSIGGSTAPMNGTLAVWDSTSVPDGLYAIRLVLTDQTHGDISVMRTVQVVNGGGG